jgi:hypothetical protein
MMLLGSMMEAPAANMDTAGSGTPLIAMPGVVAASNAAAIKSPRATDFSIAAIMGRNRAAAAAAAVKAQQHHVRSRPAGESQKLSTFVLFPL